METESREVRRLKEGIQSQIVFLQNLTETSNVNVTALIIRNLQSLLDNGQHHIELELPLNSLTIGDGNSASTTEGKRVQISGSPLEGHVEKIDQEMNDGSEKVNPAVREEANRQGESRGRLASMSRIQLEIMLQIGGESANRLSPEGRQESDSPIIKPSNEIVENNRSGSWPHILTKINQGSQKCPYCPTIHRTVKRWRAHVLTTHFSREKFFKCHHCTSSFRSTQCLQKHSMQKHHHNYPSLRMTQR